MLEILAHTEATDSLNNNDFWGHMMDGHYVNGSSYDFIWMTIFMIISAFVVTSILFYFLRSSDKKTSPLDEAKLRYAKGEITKKEYLHIKKDIND